MRNKMIGVTATRFNFLRMQLSKKQSNENQLLEEKVEIHELINEFLILLLEFLTTVCANENCCSNSTECGTVG